MSPLLLLFSCIKVLSESNQGEKEEKRSDRERKEQLSLPPADVHFICTNPYGAGEKPREHQHASWYQPQRAQHAAVPNCWHEVAIPTTTPGQNSQEISAVSKERL